MEESGDNWLHLWIILPPNSFGHGPIALWAKLPTPITPNSQTVFIGEYQHNLDDKNRLLVPSKFRAALAAGAVVTRGLDNCLFLYPLPEWQKLSQKIADLPLGQAKSRAFARLMLAGAMEVEMDRLGRITLPEYLKSFAGLKKAVVITGLMNRLEIWEESSWRSYQSQTERDSTDIAENLGSLGV